MIVYFQHLFHMVLSFHTPFMYSSHDFHTYMRSSLTDCKIWTFLWFYLFIYLFTPVFIYLFIYSTSG